MSIRCHQQLFDFMTSTTSHGEKHQNPALVLFWQKWRTYIYNFSFYSRKNMYFVKFLFLFSKLEQRIYLSHSHLESRWYFSDFSFSLQNWRNEIHISLTPLEIGEIVFKFLFLFSIGLFCLSSITVTSWHLELFG